MCRCWENFLELSNFTPQLFTVVKGEKGGLFRSACEFRFLKTYSEKKSFELDSIIWLKQKYTFYSKLQQKKTRLKDADKSDISIAAVKTFR